MAEITQEQRDELARKIIDIIGPFGGGTGPTVPPFPFPEFLTRLRLRPTRCRCERESSGRAVGWHEVPANMI